MIELDINKIEVKYITGMNKFLPEYPTPLDVLYESCKNAVDGCLFSNDKMADIYGFDFTEKDEKCGAIINKLLEHGYIEKKVSKYKIIKTPWDK